MEKITKVQAVEKLLRKHGGSAPWATIYTKIERYWPSAKADTASGQAGLRGAVYREVRNGRTFTVKEGVVSLR